MLAASFKPFLTDWLLPFASRYRLMISKCSTVISLQRTFTSLVNTHVGRTQAFPLNTTEEELISAVEEWVDLLEEGRYQEALNFIYPIPCPEWTAEYLESWIKNYGFDQPRKEAKGKQYNRTYEAYDPCRDESTRLEVVGMIFYDVPLDGEWSDLTTQFNVSKFENSLVLDMCGLHVM